MNDHPNYLAGIAAIRVGDMRDDHLAELIRQAGRRITVVGVTPDEWELLVAAARAEQRRRSSRHGSLVASLASGWSA